MKRGRAHPRAIAAQWARGAMAAGMALVASGCERSVLDPKGPVGDQERLILLDSLAIMLVIAVPTIIAALAFAWWFRQSNTKARFLPDFVYSGRIELVVWSIPILTITFLGGLIWIGSYRLDPRQPIPSAQPPLEVQAVSLDWKWLFIYPSEGVASVNQLVVPAGRPVQFDITSASVMNAFFIPQLGGMIYAMNGMVTQLHLQADQPGVYYGESAHFSGDGFSDMHFDVHAVSAADFGRWVTQTRATGPVLDSAAYGGLAQQSLGSTAFTYRAVEPGLFQKVATRALEPGPGPAAGKAGGPQVKPIGGG